MSRHGEPGDERRSLASTPSQSWPTTPIAVVNGSAEADRNRPRLGMFERIIIRQRSSQSIGQPIALGVIAEALLFYSDVLIVADYPTLRALLTVATPDVVVELVESGFLRLVYESDSVAVITEGAGSSRERHDAVYINAPRNLAPMPSAVARIWSSIANERR